VILVKAVFGILALVVVLAFVASLAKEQLTAVGAGASTGRNAAAANQSGAFSAATPAAVAADPNATTVPQQARSMQERARANTAAALEQGAQRSQRAD
jgi:hypothetical protein